MATYYEKIEEFLRKRKRPVTVEQISHHFLTRTANVYYALRRLNDEGKADWEYDPKTRCRKWRYVRRTVAVPKPAHPRVSTSYPYVRGYDD